jgi:galactose mutarotase-like enzyme
VRYGSDFEAADISGWDECFPTIGQCVYPEEPWSGVVAPDHGELWSIPWDWTIQDHTLRMWAEGVRFPYRFERAISFPQPGRLEVSYAVENRAAFPLRALWSMHPFFRVAPDTRILLPEATRIRVEVSKSARLGSFLAEHAWPVTQDRDGEEVDLSVVGPLDARFMEKVFTDRLSEGRAALYTPSNGQFVAMRFDPAAVPYVGLAAMRGGWPETGEPSYSVILEPCTGWPDRLDIAIPRGDAMEIPAKATVRWATAVHLGVGWGELEKATSAGIADPSEGRATPRLEAGR